MLRPLDVDSPGAAEDFLAHRKLLALACVEGWRFLDRPELRHLIDERVALDADPFDGPIGAAGLAARAGDGVFIAHPSNRLCIFWRAPDGTIDRLQRRRLDSQKQGKYVFTANRGPLHMYGIERARDVSSTADLVICKGAIDTVARRELECGSGRLVVGVPGANAWRSEWAALACGRTVRISTDADAAGDKAAERIAAEVWNAGAVRVVRARREAGDWADQLAARAACS